jgi:hypothetical protein
MSKEQKNVLSQLTDGQKKTPQTSTRTGLVPGWTRATVILREEHKEKLELVAFMSDIPLKDVIDKILSNFFSDKDIQPLPKMGKDQILKLFTKKKASKS